MSTAALSYSGPLTETKSSAKTASPAAAASRKRLLVRFYDALVEARMRQAMRELAMHRHLLPESSVTIER
jgi:hypothetical protein